MTRKRTTFLAILLGCAISVNTAHAATVTLLKVADSFTAAPGGGTYVSFDRASISNGLLAFSGSTSATYGTYTFNGSSLGLIVDRNTPIPGGTGNFGNTSLSILGEGISGNAIAFSMFSGGGPTSGLYLSQSGVVTTLADTSTPLPGCCGTFHGFGDVVIEGSNIAFEANEHVSSPVPNGVYKRVGGVLSVVADETTSVPGQATNFARFGSPSLDNNNVAFAGFWGTNDSGIYTDAGLGLSKVIDKSSPVPGSTGNFSSLGQPSFDSGNIVFDGSVNTTNFSAIYLTDDLGATFQTIASTNMAVPNGVGNFLHVQGGLTDAGNVAFQGVDSDLTHGIYAYYDGQLIEVIDNLITLDGKPVHSLRTMAFRGNQIVFQADLVEDEIIPGRPETSRSLYVAIINGASVPEPATLVLAGLALCGVIVTTKLRRLT